MSNNTTVTEVISAALDQFGLDPDTHLVYRMLKLVLDKGTILIIAHCCAVNVLKNSLHDYLSVINGMEFRRLIRLFAVEFFLIS